ncbi:hypothetical protein J6590_006044, partial [Homalodisca vitripennis]
AVYLESVEAYIARLSVWVCKFSTPLRITTEEGKQFGSVDKRFGREIFPTRRRVD